MDFATKLQKISDLQKNYPIKSNISPKICCFITTFAAVKTKRRWETLKIIFYLYNIY